MQKKNLEENFSQNTKCTIGIGEFSESGLRLPFYAIDFGKHESPVTEIILLQQPFSLNVNRREKGKYAYLVHGAGTMSIISSEKAPFQMPSFSTVFEVGEETHNLFQDKLKEVRLWVLLIETSVSSRFVIDEAGIIREHFDHPRENIFKKD